MKSTCEECGHEFCSTCTEFMDSTNLMFWDDWVTAIGQMISLVIQTIILWKVLS